MTKEGGKTIKESNNKSVIENCLEQIGKNVKRFRGELTQEDLARKANVGLGTLRRMEKGISIELDNLLKIAKALGIHPADLFILEKDRLEITYKHKLLMDRFSKLFELERKEGIDE